MREIHILNDDLLQIIDADTLEYDGVRYRLAGYDAPESRTKSEFEKRMACIAMFRFRWLLKPHQDRVLVLSEKKDGFGRTLASLVVNGEDVKDLAVREGWGIPYKKGSKSEWSTPESVVQCRLERCGTASKVA